MRKINDLRLYDPPADGAAVGSAVPGDEVGGVEVGVGCACFRAGGAGGKAACAVGLDFAVCDVVRIDDLVLRTPTEHHAEATLRALPAKTTESTTSYHAEGILTSLSLVLKRLTS